MWMLTKANGYTLDAVNSRFDAVVYENGRVVAVGTEADLRLQYGTHISRVLDVEGATVIPGLIDSHLHVAGLGEQSMKLDLTGVQSGRDLLSRVRTYASGLPENEWVLGGGWDDNRFEEPGLPSLYELDEATGGRPLLLTRVCHHAYLTNRAGYLRAGLGENPANPEDGLYGRDDGGRLTGVVYENAVQPLLRAVPAKTKSLWKSAVQAGMQKALASGITAVHTDDVRNLGSFEAVWSTYHELIHDDGFKLRIHELVDWHAIDECLRALKDLPAPSEWLERGAAKLFSDGAMGGRTAWLSEPYSDMPGWNGTPMYTKDELFHRVRYAHERGFGAAVHAIGDAATDLTLRAMEAAPVTSQRDRLIHAEIVREDLIERMQRMGNQLAIDIQPRFTVSDFPWIVDRVGIERIRYTCAWRTLRERGLHLAGGSDAPIEPVAPLLGIHAAATRRPPGSHHEGYQTQESLERLDAIRLFGVDAAFAAGRENEQGVIAPGRYADFTVLDQDILASDSDDTLLSAKVRYTIVGGNIAYRESNAGAEKVV